MTKSFFRIGFCFFGNFLLSQVLPNEALTRLLVEKGVFTKEEFLEMVKIVNEEMNKEKL